MTLEEYSSVDVEHNIIAENLLSFLAVCRYGLIVRLPRRVASCAYPDTL